MQNDKTLDFFINLGTYKPKYMAFRVLAISLTAILLIRLSVVLANEAFGKSESKFLIYFLTIVAFNSVSEVNLLVTQIIRQSRKLRNNIYLQGLIVFAISLFLIFFWIKTAERVLSEENLLQHRATQFTLISGFLILVIHLLFIIISNLTREWIKNRKEIEKLKQAKLLSDYNSLKDRLNPHFLFNNLSVLKSLIHYNPTVAEVFTQNFTNVYRYVLKSHEEQTVTLHEELRFLESYVALHKERIGEGLSVEVNVNEGYVSRRIPPLTLQLLVENAIKHNVATKSSPLKIAIYINDNRLVVINNLNKKESTYSTQTGLKTLSEQYKLISGQEILITISEGNYIVQLPLL